MAAGQLVVGPAGNTAGLGQPRGGDGSRRLKCEIAGLLGDGKWRTSAEIGRRVGVRKQVVTDALKASLDLFRWEPGGPHGRKHNAVLWQLADTGAAEVPNLLTQQAEKEQALRDPTGLQAIGAYETPPCPSLPVPRRREQPGTADTAHRRRDDPGRDDQRGAQGRAIICRGTPLPHGHSEAGGGTGPVPAPPTVRSP